MVFYLYNLMQRFLAGNSFLTKKIGSRVLKITANVNYVFQGKPLLQETKKQSLVLPVMNCFSCIYFYIS